MDHRLFTARELASYRYLKRGRWSNAGIAARWSRDADTVDIALNTLLGRNGTEAAIILNHRLLAAA